MTARAAYFKGHAFDDPDEARANHARYDEFFRREFTPSTGEEKILRRLADATQRFSVMERDYPGEFDVFCRQIEEAEKLVVMRLARRTAATPLCPGDIVDTDDIEMELRWLAAGEARERREAYFTYYMIAAIAVFAAVGAALRFLGVGA